jgi:hypothetical protein
MAAGSLGLMPTALAQLQTRGPRAAKLRLAPGCLYGHSGQKTTQPGVEGDVRVLPAGGLEDRGEPLAWPAPGSAPVHQGDALLCDGLLERVLCQCDGVPLENAVR